MYLKYNILMGVIRFGWLKSIYNLRSTFRSCTTFYAFLRVNNFSMTTKCLLRISKTFQIVPCVVYKSTKPIPFRSNDDYISILFNQYSYPLIFSIHYYYFILFLLDTVSRTGIWCWRIRHKSTAARRTNLKKGEIF